MKKNDLTGHWENKDRSLQITFNGNQYELYTAVTNKTYKGNYQTTEVEKPDGPCRLLTFSPGLEIYLWIICDDDDIVLKDDKGGIDNLKRKN
jgi:hypothetical protein